MSVSSTCDVLVVGAGFTGLSAAVALKDAGIDLLVLEARGRVGGRVEPGVNGLGESVDAGGQFLCEDMPQVMALVAGQGRALVETRLEGEVVTQPPVAREQSARIYAATMGLRERMKALQPHDPSIAGLSVAAWLAGQSEDADAKAGFRSMIEGLWCLPLEDMPLWYMVSNDRRVTNEAFELQYFPEGTMHAVAASLAAGLGDRVRLGAPVDRIEHGVSGVRAVGAFGSVSARAALVAVPPVAAGRIGYAPPLPGRLAYALGAWRSGMVLKGQLRYARPFWRERGLSGMVMWRDPAGLFAFDGSQDAAHPMLGVFAGGPLAADWSGFSREEIGAAFVDRLVAALGPDAAEVEDFFLRDWIGDRWSGGAYSDLVVDFAATDAEDVLRAGAPPLFFASSELSPSFPGYIEGAIVAGRETAGGIARWLAG